MTVHDVENFDAKTVSSFGNEWNEYDQKDLKPEEHQAFFDGYFSIFPWDALPKKAEGFDMGCGSGRWALLSAPRVGKLNCIDPAEEALDVARKNLNHLDNVNYIHARTQTVPLKPASQDFGYCLGVLHHIPDTKAAMQDCVNLLKPGAPFLVYLYYRFDNRPAWFRGVWRLSEIIRSVICKLPRRLKSLSTDLIAALVYWPLARFAKLGKKLGLNMRNAPLYFYRDSTFYSMRTDSRDRFGTPLEQRFTRVEIKAMMESVGLENVRFREDEPYWVAVGEKSS